MRACVHTCVYYTCVCVCMHANVCVHACMRVCMCATMYNNHVWKICLYVVCVHAYIHQILCATIMIIHAYRDKINSQKILNSG